MRDLFNGSTLHICVYDGTYAQHTVSIYTIFLYIMQMETFIHYDEPTKLSSLVKKAYVGYLIFLWHLLELSFAHEQHVKIPWLFIYICKSLSRTVNVNLKILSFLWLWEKKNHYTKMNFKALHFSLEIPTENCAGHWSSSLHLIPLPEHLQGFSDF